MSGRALVASLVCVGLAGCMTDKIAMSSEVGGGGSSSVFARSAGSGGFGGEGGDAGLGVIGDGGVLDNVVGVDPIGGLLDGLGPDNPLETILGGGSAGLIPSAAAALAGDPDAEVVGLGIAGEGGLVADLAGTDLLGGMLDTGGVLTASIAGGNDGLLGALLNDKVGEPPLAPVAGPLAAALPSSALNDALAQLPALGLTGSDGLIADLTGTDLVGNLLGPDTPLGGGNGGQLGDIVPAGEPLLGYVGDATNGLLNVVAGNEISPADSLLAPAVPVLDNILGTGASVIGSVAAPVTDALGGVPVVGDVVGGQSAGALTAAPDTGAPSTTPGILAPVTGLVGGLVGGL
ncbi:MAG: hypothetical protein AMXMBFR74_09550 [Parvibaculum sp.]|uniref:hypothetical protein n=1 Tax=Parvibaculum sp. TaxID=2024848 RepID=UPI0035B808B0